MKVPYDKKTKVIRSTMHLTATVASRGADLGPEVYIVVNGLAVFRRALCKQGKGRTMMEEIMSRYREEKGARKDATLGRRA